LWDPSQCISEDPSKNLGPKSKIMKLPGQVGGNIIFCGPQKAHREIWAQ
jgi:hypothetical protein